MRKAKTLAVLLAAVLAAAPCTAWADDLDVTTESTATYAITVESVTAQIESITEETSSQEVKEIYQNYLSLSLSEQLQIPDTTKLDEAVAKYQITVNGANVPQVNGNANEEDKETTKSGRDYTFYSDGTASLSLSIQYSSAEDGTIDVPAIYITAPDGTQTQANSQTTQISDEDKQITIHWESSFAQMDIAKVPEGNWTVTTTTDVTFVRLDYAGGTSQFSAATEAEETEIVPAAEEEETTSLTVFDLLLPVIFIILIIFLIFMKKRPKGKAQTAQAGEKKTGAHRNSDYVGSRDEQILELRKEWEKERENYIDVIEKKEEKAEEEKAEEKEIIEEAPVEEVTDSDISDFSLDDFDDAEGSAEDGTNENSDPYGEVKVTLPDGFGTEEFN